MTMQDPRVLRDDAGAVDAVGLQSLYPACAERDQGGALGLAGVRSALRRYAGGGTCLARLDDRPRGARKAGRERRPQLTQFTSVSLGGSVSVSAGRGVCGDVVSSDHSRRPARRRPDWLGQVSAEPAQGPADHRPLMPVVVHHHPTAPAQPVPKPAPDRRAQRVFPVHGLLMQKVRTPHTHRDLRMTTQPHQPLIGIPLAAAPAVGVAATAGIARSALCRRRRLGHSSVSCSRCRMPPASMAYPPIACQSRLTMRPCQSRLTG